MVDLSAGNPKISKNRVRFSIIVNPFYIDKEHFYTLTDMDFNFARQHI